MKLLKGKKIAERILGNLRKEIEKKRLRLKLAVVLVGDNAVSKIFIKQKKITCEKIGIDFELFRFPEKIKFADLKKEIEKISQNPKISAVVIQLPLSSVLKNKTQEILNIISPEKDIDVLSEYNLGRFYSGTLPALPPVVGAISYLLKEYKIPIKGENVLLVGAGRLVGFPLTIWFLKEEATVSVINEFTKNVSFFTKKADIIISGVGKPNLINSSMVKKGAVVIDAGTSYKNGELVGDVDFKSVSKKASFITPVPGGVGPLTVACLLENLIRLSRK